MGSPSSQPVSDGINLTEPSSPTALKTEDSQSLLDQPDDDLDLGPCPYASAPVTSSDRVAADGNLTVLSKRTERNRKRQQKRLAKKPNRGASSELGLVDLPYELLLAVLAGLRPSDLFTLARTCWSLRDFVLGEQQPLARTIIAQRYPCLAKSLPLPVTLRDVDPVAHPALQHPGRQSSMGIHKRFQHVKPPDPAFLCTCLTCILRWNSLCVAVDFAGWQDSLDAGEPIPTIPRGKFPEWNGELVAANAGIVKTALTSPLWYASILERHLASSTRSIRRHAENKGNRRRRYLMTREDEASGTDVFLESRGPPTLDFPFHRDNYYMLEAYLPNRGWNSEELRWMYMPDWHERDLQWVIQRWGEATRRFRDGPW